MIVMIRFSSQCFSKKKTQPSAMVFVETQPSLHPNRKFQTKQDFFVKLFIGFLQEKEAIKLLRSHCGSHKFPICYPLLLLFVQKIAKYKRLREENTEISFQKCVDLVQQLKCKFFDTADEELSEFMSKNIYDYNENQSTVHDRLCSISTKLDTILNIDTQEETATDNDTLATLLSYSLFDELYYPVLHFLATPLISSLLKTKNFLEFYTKNSASIPSLKNLVVEHLQQTSDNAEVQDIIFVSDPRIRKHHSVSEEDISFLKLVAESSADKWNVVVQDQSFTVFKSKTKYGLELYGQGCANIFTVKGNIQYSVQKLLDTILNSHFKSIYDNNFIQHVVLDKIPKSLHPNSFETIISLESYPFTWPVQNRDFVTANSVVYDDKAGVYYIISKPTEHYSVPQKKGTTRGIHFGGFILEKVSENQTLYTQITCSDFRCQNFTSESVIEAFLKKRAKNFHKSLLLCLQNSSTSSQKNSMEMLRQIARRNSLSDLLPYSPPRLIATERKNSDNRKTFSPSYNIVRANLKRITYYSLFSHPMTDSQLQSIEKIAQQLNAKRNITGLLLYTADPRIIKTCYGIFYQVIEGECSVIDALFAKLQLDTRHCYVKIISEEEQLQESDRQYPSWSMESYNLDHSNHFFNSTIRELITRLENSEITAQQ